MGKLFGGESKQKLLFVPDADNKPEEDHEISEPALFRFLLNEELRKQFNEAEVKIPQMLDVLKYIDKQSNITQVEIHRNSMYSTTDLIGAFHVFVIFKTSSETDGEYWWSLEKGLEYIFLQRSRNKENVKDKLEGDKRKDVQPVKEGLKGKGTIKNLFTILSVRQVIAEKSHFKKSNCQSLVTFVGKRITEEEYEYEGYYECLPPPENVRDKKMLEFLINLLDSGVNEWHPLFNLILLGNTDLVDKFMKSGKYNINDFYKGLTPLQLAIGLSKTKMVKHLLNDQMNADPTKRDKSGKGALHLAAIYTRKTEIFDILLAHPKLSVDDVDEHGQTALYWATLMSNVFTVEKLIEKGANPNLLCKSGNSPLHRAALERDDNGVIDLLLASGKLKVDNVDGDGRTALHWAVVASNVIAVKKLLDKGADPNIPDKDDRSPLHLAAQQRDGSPVIDLLLEAQKVKGSGNVNDRNERGRTALHHAALYSNEITAEHLIEKGADLHCRDSDGNTSLHFAAVGAKDMKIIEFLLQNIKEGDMSRYNNNERLIRDAMRNKYGLKVEIGERLLKKGIITMSMIDKWIEDEERDVTSPFTEKDVDPSMDLETFYGRRIARAKNPQEIVEILKDGRFDINGRDQNGRTILFSAIGANNVNAVRILLERGADPTIGGNDGYTPFQVAVILDKDCDIIKLLLESGKVDIDETRYNKGQTALHMVIDNSNTATAEFLMSKGANPNIADKKGNIPLHLAARNAKDMRIVELLLNHPDVDVNCLDNAGLSVLSYAEMNEHGIGEKITNLLRKKGAVEANELLTIQNAMKKMRLRIFSSKNPEEVTNFFSDDDTIPIEEKFDKISEEHLLSAIKDSNFEIVRNLLNSGADVRTCGEKGANLLHLASFHAKMTELIDFILEKGKFDINEVDDDGLTIIHHALIGINPTINTAHLIRLGADPNIADKNGITPLHFAARNEETTELIDIILKTGQCNINGVDNDGRTPLHYAIKRPNPITINARRLIKMGANTNIADKNGVTPLHMAARNAESMDLIEIFLKTEKLNVNDYDHNGLTALAYARSNKHGLGQKIVNRLEEYGANE